MTSYVKILTNAWPEKKQIQKSGSVNACGRSKFETANFKIVGGVGK